MALYVDGFLLSVPKKKLNEYKKMATVGRKVWMKHGALQYVEAVGDDMKPNFYPFKIMHFPKVAKTKPGEVTIFSFITFKSRAHRDSVNKKVMKDPVMNDPKAGEKPMPFDMKRMVYGGFSAIVES